MTTYIVSGAAAVLKVRGGEGGERYLYKNALVPKDVYLVESVKNALDAGLLTEVEEVAAEPADATPASTDTGTATTPAAKAAGAETPKAASAAKK